MMKYFIKKLLIFVLVLVLFATNVLAEGEVGPKLEYRRLRTRLNFYPEISSLDNLKCHLDGVKEWVKENPEDLAKVKEIIRIFGTDKHRSYTLIAPSEEYNYPSLLVRLDRVIEDKSVEDYYRRIGELPFPSYEEGYEPSREDVIEYFNFVKDDYIVQDGEEISEEELEGIYESLKEKFFGLDDRVVTSLIKSWLEKDMFEAQPEYGLFSSGEGDQLKFFYVYRNTMLLIYMEAGETGIDKGDFVFVFNLKDLKLASVDLREELAKDFFDRIFGKAITIAVNDRKWGEYIYKPHD